MIPAAVQPDEIPGVVHAGADDRDHRDAAAVQQGRICRAVAGADPGSQDQRTVCVPGRGGDIIVLSMFIIVNHVQGQVIVEHDNLLQIAHTGKDDCQRLGQGVLECCDVLGRVFVVVIEVKGLIGEYVRPEIKLVCDVAVQIVGKNILRLRLRQTERAEIRAALPLLNGSGNILQKLLPQLLVLTGDRLNLRAQLERPPGIAGTAADPILINGTTLGGGIREDCAADLSAEGIPYVRILEAALKDVRLRIGGRGPTDGDLPLLGGDGNGAYGAGRGRDNLRSNGNHGAVFEGTVCLAVAAPYPVPIAHTALCGGIRIVGVEESGTQGDPAARAFDPPLELILSGIVGRGPADADPAGRRDRRNGSDGAGRCVEIDLRIAVELCRGEGFILIADLQGLPLRAPPRIIDVCQGGAADKRSAFNGGYGVEEGDGFQAFAVPKGAKIDFGYPAAEHDVLYGVAVSEGMHPDFRNGGRDGVARARSSARINDQLTHVFAEDDPVFAAEIRISR